MTDCIVAEDWKISHQYNVGQLLGSGSFGSVVRAVDKTSNIHVAIKRIQNIFRNESDGKKVFREMFILRQLRHQHVIQLLHVTHGGDTSLCDLYFVLEFADTDLEKLMLDRAISLSFDEVSIC